MGILVILLSSTGVVALQINQSDIGVFLPTTPEKMYLQILQRFDFFASETFFIYEEGPAIQCIKWDAATKSALMKGNGEVVQL